MGATALGTFSPSFSLDRLTLAEIDKLSRAGIEIPLEDVRVLDDGTLAYKDSRVLLYIRDVTLYHGGRSQERSLPRFHVSNCRTLQDMRDKNRFARYVVATRDDGRFDLNIAVSGSGKLLPRQEQLNVCQNCLTKLSFDGFRSDWTYPKKSESVVHFSLQRFFALYPKSLHVKTPSHTDRTAPLNKYPDNFTEISRKIKRDIKWTCEACHVDCSATGLQRFLQVHHKNAQKNENHRANLVALCLRCHAEEPLHVHIKNLPEYREFIRLVGTTS
jgi:hypothetical protein